MKDYLILYRIYFDSLTKQLKKKIILISLKLLMLKIDKLNILRCCLDVFRQ